MLLLPFGGSRDLPGGPGAKTLLSQCGGLDPIPGEGELGPTIHN